MVDQSDYNAVFKLKIKVLWVKIQTNEVSMLDFDEINDFDKKTVRDKKLEIMPSIEQINRTFWIK